MASEGELVRMQNGRWARYQAVQICNAGRQDEKSTATILVAVELEERFQELLTAAETALVRRSSSGDDAVPSAAMH